MNFQNVNLDTMVTRFGRGGRSVSSKATPLTDEQLREYVPSIFAPSKHESRSDRYGYVSTLNVINALRKEGFEPFHARQGGSSVPGKKDFTKHMVRLRRADIVMRDVGDAIPEVVMLNAHDGTSRYALSAGVMRLVCLNGLVISDDAFESASIKVSHYGDIIGQVIEGSYKVIEAAASQTAKIENMKAIALDPDAQREFAKEALSIRFEGDPPKEIDVMDVLRTSREADVGNSLWKVYNRAQENLMRGGVPYRTRTDEGRETRRMVRPVNGIDYDVNMNKAMWGLAERFLQTV